MPSNASSISCKEDISVSGTNFPPNFPNLPFEEGLFIFFVSLFIINILIKG